MQLSKFSLVLFFTGILIFSACKKEEKSTNDDGVITFYTKSTGGNCGDITILLNGTEIGKLTDTTSTTPVCNASYNNGMLSVGVDAGAHDYSASDTCNNIWTGTIIINQGDCKLKELDR